MENNIIVYGASGLEKVVVDILKKSNSTINAIIDDSPKSANLLGVPIQVADGFDYPADAKVILAIGNNKVRKRLSNQLQVNFASVVHPSVILSDASVIGEGTVVMAGAIINPDATVGNHCIVNTGAVIEHDCTIGDFAHISPNASLAGGVEIGEGAQVGIGAVVIQGVKIGKWAVIGAGAVIIRDVPDDAVVVGNPGRIIKYGKYE